MPLLPGEPPHADEVAERGTKAWRQAVDAHRAWVGNQLWTQQATNQLNLSDPNAMKQALSGLGINNEVGGGRHAWNLFLGQLPTEGFGMSPSRPDLSYAMEAYMPSWRHDLDRAIQGGMSRTDANTRFLPSGAPGSAGPASSGFPGSNAPTLAPSYSGPGVPGSSGSMFTGGTPGSYSSLDNDDEDAWNMAQGLFKKRRPSGTLGSLGGY